MRSTGEDLGGDIANQESSKDPCHWMMYVKWENIETWKKRVDSEDSHEDASHSARDGGRSRPFPYAFGSRQEKFLDLEGDVLWLFTLPRYHGYCQAPSLVARLDINGTGSIGKSEGYLTLAPEVIESGPYFVTAEEDPDSYLPINNFFHVLLGLEFYGRAPNLRESYEGRDRSRDVARGPYFSLPNHFRRLRRIQEECVPDLEDFALAVNSGRRVFLSYKRDDFEGATGVTRQGGVASFPQQVGELLEGAGFSCWWDHWHIPTPEGESRFDEGLLTNILDDAVRQSCWFVALMTRGFCSKPTGEDAIWWTKREWERAGAERGRDSRKRTIRRMAVFIGNTGSDRDLLEAWLTDDQDISVEVSDDSDPRFVSCRITEAVDELGG